MKLRIKTVLNWRPILAVAIGLAYASSATADFIVDPNPSKDYKLMLDKSSEGNLFTGTVLDSHVVFVGTMGDVETASGWANVKPSKNDSLTSLMFTPDESTIFNAFSFRVQLEDSAEGELRVEVMAYEIGTQIFDFSGLGNGLSDRIGILSDNYTIEWVRIYNTNIKEIKEISFGFGNGTAGVPDAGATAGLLSAGLLGLFVVRRRF